MHVISLQSLSQGFGLISFSYINYKLSEVICFPLAFVYKLFYCTYASKGQFS
jgi:hypothetical protein